MADDTIGASEPQDESPSGDGPAVLDQQAHHDRLRRRAVHWSLGIGVLVLLLKGLAYQLTGSSAIFSDVLESIVHVVATGLVWYAMRVALQPPDEDHPYGHGKAEYFSVGFEGALIFMAGAVIIWHTIERLLVGAELVRLDFGLALIGAVAVINLILGLYLRRIGQRTASPLLLGDADHVLSDVYTTGGVFIGVLLVRVTGQEWLDRIIALAVAGFLMWTAFRMMRRSMGALMDRTDNRVAERVVAIVNRLREPGWGDLHNLRVRRMGERTYVEFHLSVPGDWSIAHGHTVMERIEAAVMEDLGVRGAVLIHLDCLAEGNAGRLDAFHMEEAVRRRPAQFDR